MPVILNTVAER